MKIIRIAAVCALVSALGCANRHKEQDASQMPPVSTAEPEPAGEPATDAQPEGARTAVATLQSAPNESVSGTVTFTETGGAVQIDVDIQGLTPGEHGLHVHEAGDCSPPDFTTAGEHFAPLGHPHGAPYAQDHHAGDFGNIMADDSGTARTTILVDYITLTEGISAIVGRSIIVHADRDDMISQPSGNSGARVGCGLILLQTDAASEGEGGL